MNKILYIGGYGRSGSTMADAILGDAEHYFAVGEFRRLFESQKNGILCSCKSEIQNCSLWGEVLRRFSIAIPEISWSEADRITVKIEQYNNWFLKRHENTQEWEQYKRIWQTLIDITCELTGSHTLVDSSKSSTISCNRAAALGKFVEVEQVHLVRDPRAVLNSMLNAEQRRFTKHNIQKTPFRTVKTYISWTLTNAYLQIVSRLHSDHKPVLVRYEDLTCNPRQSLSQVSRSITIDIDSISHKIDNDIPFESHHIFNGDLQRMNGKYKVRPDTPKWRANIGFFRRLTAYMTYPLARCYGYLRLSDF